MNFHLPIIILLIAVVPVFECSLINICQSKSLTCQCGQTHSYPIHLQVKQCPRVYRWRPYCGDCKGDPSDVQRCSAYRNCLECEVNKCKLCPPGRYGTWCTGICPLCANGGICQKNTGMCQCPEGLSGPTCESTSGCLVPNSHIENGEVIDWKKQYVFGSSVTYKCYDGYKMQSSAISYCLESGLWSHQPPNCINVTDATDVPLIDDCEWVYENLNHGLIVYDPLLKKLSFSCDNGFELVGDEERHCKPDGRWSGIEPKCVNKKLVGCSLPSIPSSTLLSTTTESEAMLPVGTRVEFSCESDFVLLGEESILCQSNKNWTAKPPICVQKNQTCTHPGKFTNGKVKVSGENSKSKFAIGATIRFTCEPLYYLDGEKSITCESDNYWSGPIPVCIKLVTSPPIKSVTHQNENIILTTDKQ